MSAKTKIEWCDHTFNPWWGCTRVSPGCQHCYAEMFAKRVGHAVWGSSSERRFFGDEHWREPLKWNAKAVASGRRERVFCASMADVFEDRPDLIPHRQRLFDLIDETPALDWLLLTKRPENIRPLMDRASHGTFGSAWNFADHMPNVWLGTTVEDQARADERIPALLDIPACVRFLSCEPLLESVSLAYSCFNGADSYGAMPGIHWVICGGESGPGARPMHPVWARSLRDQCAASDVAFYFKQWGEWVSVDQPEDADDVVSAVNSFPNGRWLGLKGEKTHVDWDTVMVGRVGKHAAGRLLDGVEHSEFPRRKEEA